MDINAQFCTFIGANFEELMRCYLTKIESFDNITGEGITVNSTKIYEYFTIGSGNDAFRFCVAGILSSRALQCFVCNDSSSGGTGIDTATSYYWLTEDSGYGGPDQMQYYRDSGSGLYYDNCWVFSSDNNFVGMSRLFAQSQLPQGWFLFLKNHNNVYQLLRTRRGDQSTALHVYSAGSTDGRYIQLLNVNTYITDDTARKQDMPDYVYIENRVYRSDIDYSIGILPDLYYVHNFMIYDNGRLQANTTPSYYPNGVKSFQLVGTEDGNYMHLSQDNFLKISEVLEKEIMIYEAA